jgi:ribosomal peptide maturation radical SAM protein 1
MSKVLLCCMPFSPADTPRLGLGLLKAGLTRAGIACDVRYFSLDFARRVGEEFYNALAAEAWSFATMAGEWIFTPGLFGAGSVRPDEYLLWAQGLAPRDFTAETWRGVLHAQAQVEPFLQDCLDRLDWEDYDIIGFSSIVQQNNASLALAKRIKQRWPEKAIIFGGHNVQDVMGVELLRTFDCVDYACLGEGDVLLPEFVRRFRAGEELEDIPGLALRRDGHIQVAALVPRAIQDLDELPYPDYDDYFEQRQSVLGSDFWSGEMPLESSRGCWWREHQKCTYCGVDGQDLGYREKSPRRVFEEIEYLAGRYGAWRLTMADAVAPRHLAPFLDCLETRDPRVALFYELRAGMAKHRLARMKRAGIGHALIGVESLSTPILRLMRKGTTALTNIQTLKWCRELGIRVYWKLLGGIPLEEPSEYRKMSQLIPSLAHLTPPRTVSVLLILRFSPHFQDPARFGFANVRPAAPYAYIYPGVPERALRNLARHFDYEHADGRDTAAYMGPVRQAIEAWREAAPASILAYVDDGERLRLFDTRPVAREQVRVLTGLERTLYLACDRQQSLKRLARRFVVVEPDALQQALGQMVEEQVMVAEGKKYLSLAVDIGRQLKPGQRAMASDGLCLALARGLMGTEPVGEC